MSSQVKAINEFFRLADRDDVDGILASIILTDRQQRMFEMRYIRGLDINFIADTLGCCPRVVNKELRLVRAKISKHLGL